MKAMPGRLLDRKSYRSGVVVILLYVIIICPAYYSPGQQGFANNSVDAWYVEQLHRLKAEVVELKQALAGKKGLGLYRQHFKKCRLAYKKAAIFIEYFNSYEARSLNGPSLERVEEGSPDVIIEPHGFQVLEEYLFGEAKPSIDKLNRETDIILDVVEQLEDETGRAYKFRDEEIWEALRMAVIRLTTLGISGFDSPLAEYSIQEAKATIAGIAEVLVIYQTELGKNESKINDVLALRAKLAIGYLARPVSFNSFNRLAFITQFVNPLSEAINLSRRQLNLKMPGGRRPLHPTNTIFDAGAFNIDFFSPNERFTVTPERIKLGRRLFYDPLLSGNRKRSCATCHRPEMAFTDGRKTAIAIDGSTLLMRNTPTLWNSVFQTKQFFDSRTSVLENQLSDVVHNKAEMKGSLKESIPELKNNPEYSLLFKRAYAAEKDFISEYTIANAISSYVRSLVAMNSKFDQYMHGSKQALQPAEKNGFNLFMGKAKCGTCHFIPLFNGLLPADFTETESEVIGVPATKGLLHAELDPDPGKFNFTRSILHKNSFKTPTLRNISITAPYMHNGVFSTLEEVMDFYNRGGGNVLRNPPANQTLPGNRLQLSKKEISDIISFMKALTDSSSKN